MRYIVILVLAASCGPICVPNTRNVTLFKEGGEFQASAFATTAGVDGQLGYALSDHLAIMGSYSYGNRKETTPKDYTRKNSYAEAGIGYYEVKRRSRVEIFGGYGFGQGTSHDQYSFFGLNNDVVATGKFNKIFIQPSIGTNKRYFNIAFTPRVSVIQFTEFASEGFAPVNPANKNEKARQVFVEPAISGKFHIVGNLHGIFQLGLAVPMRSNEVYYDYMPAQLAVGIQFDSNNKLRTRVYKK